MSDKDDNYFITTRLINLIRFILGLSVLSYAPIILSITAIVVYIFTEWILRKNLVKDKAS